MANRPCYRPLEKYIGYRTVESAPFAWNAGFAFSQKQKNVVALHDAIRKVDPEAKILEISSKSLQQEGVQLSAFFLKLDLNGRECSVESAFQSGKVFDGGVGPFPELASSDSREVRHFVQEKSAGHALVAFELDGVRWDLNPKTAFFFYLYIKALCNNPELGDYLMQFDAFTDIEFNPKRQVNCQAATAAFYVSLRRQGRLEWAMESKENFILAHGA